MAEPPQDGLLPFRHGVDRDGVHLRASPLRPRNPPRVRGPRGGPSRPSRRRDRLPGGPDLVHVAPRGVHGRPRRSRDHGHPALGRVATDARRRVRDRPGCGAARPRRAKPHRQRGGLGERRARGALHGRRLLLRPHADRQPPGDRRLVAVRARADGRLPDLRDDARGLRLLPGDRVLRRRRAQPLDRPAGRARRDLLPVGRPRAVARRVPRLERGSGARAGRRHRGPGGGRRRVGELDSPPTRRGFECGSLKSAP